MDFKFPPKRQLALIADDSEAQQEVLKAHLENEGYDVICAYDGVEAVDAFRQYYPNLVLMDINMPHLDGWEAAKQIRKLADEHFVPILFVSSSDTDDVILKSIEVGGDDFISIPFSAEKLRSKLIALKRIGDMYRQYYVMQQEQIKDQEIAEQLFSKVIESENVGLGHIEVVKQPASIFSGDVVLTSQSPDGGLHILLGDFTGHGLKSTVGAFSTAEIFRTMITKGYAAKVVLNQINQKLYNLLPHDMFLAVALVSILPNEGVIRIWNSGLPDVLLFDGERGIVKHRIASFHPPLGIVPQLISPIEDEVYKIEPTDVVVLVSDGVIEARNNEGEMFGELRFLDACSQGIKTSTIGTSVKKSLKEFCADAIQEDDISLISFSEKIIYDISPSLIPECEVNGSKLQQDTICFLDGEELWTWHITLSGQQLAKVNLVPLIMNYIQEVEGKSDHWNNLYTVLTELYVNALDHGILDLSSDLKNSPEGFVEYFKVREKKLLNLESGKIEILLVRYAREQGGKINIKIKDSGSGFSIDAWRLLQESLEQQSSQIPFAGLSGRGIKLVQSLCESIHYTDLGTCVEADYVWHQ